MTDEAMSPLRRRMIEDMTIRKLGRKTQQDFMAMHPQPGAKNKRSSLHRQQMKPTTSPGALQ